MKFKRLTNFIKMADKMLQDIEEISPPAIMREAFATSPTKEKSSYYKLASGAECIDLIDDISDRENVPGRVRMYAGNAAEYIWRCGKKPGVDWRDDLFKAANELYRAVTGSFMSAKIKKAFFAKYEEK